MRIGVVGCGRLFERGYGPALRRMSGARLVAVADPDLGRCRRLAPDTPAFPDAALLLDAGLVDALVLATPCQAHLAAARLAAEAAVPALVEKPPAADLPGAVALASLSPVPWLGFNRRFDRGLARLRGVVPQDGPLRLHLEQTNTGEWGSYVVRDDALLSLGPHLLDLVRWLTGAEIARVRAPQVGPRSAELEVETQRGSARIRIATDRRPKNVVDVLDGTGRRIARSGGEGLLGRGIRWLVQGGGSRLVDLLTRQLEAFVRAAGGEPAPTLATARDGVPVMAAIEAARHSSRSGSDWVAVPSEA